MPWLKSNSKMSFFSEHICYCEHPNERIPKSGIMCGDPTKGFKRTGYCGASQRCTGTGDPSQGIHYTKKEELCETGNFIF